ncbi:hypothetical protein JCM10449v2_008111 [Rhodotorula kratochvilovae]
MTGPSPPVPPLALRPSDRLLAHLPGLTEAADASSTSGESSATRARLGRADLVLVGRAGAGAGGAAGEVAGAAVEGKAGEAAVLVLRDGEVRRVLPVRSGSSVAVEQTAGGFRITLSSAPEGEAFAFEADTLSAPITAFLAAFKDAQKTAARDGHEGDSNWAREYMAKEAEGARSPVRTRARAASSLCAIPPPSPLRLSPDPLAAGDGARPFDPADAGEDYSVEERAATERWLADRLREREGEFMRKEEIRVWCGTFNVNDKQPKTAADIQPWLDGCGGAELLVFGFQELDLSTEAMLRYTPYREDAWRRVLEEALPARYPDVSYTKLKSQQLVGALMLVYVREDVREHVRDVSGASLATGLMGMLANKGAVGVRLRYRDAPLTFINSHLAAFVQNVSQRNAQFRDTAAQLVFPYSRSSERAEAWAPNLRPDAPKVGEGWGVWESEVLVWLGDLNYRIDLPRVDVDRMLRVQKQHGLAFQGFEEAPITFPPTFKFDNGTQDYDTSEKQRVPSWTDRILYLAMRDDSVLGVERYASHPEITMSDHKPVSALFTLSVYEIVQEKRREVQQEIMAELDQYDNDAMPDIKLAPGPSVEFEEIRYDELVSREIEVVNVGSVIAPWSFVIKPGTTSLCPPWLTISPTSGLVLPCSRQTVTLTIHITSSTGAGALSFPSSPSTAELADLLVLSVRGKDLFLSLSARAFVPTVFGAALPHLVRLEAPIRSTTLAQRVAIAQDAAGEKKEGEPLPRSAVPMALASLVGFLAEHALDLPGLFGTPGDEGLVELARECLDTGVDFPLDRFFPSPEPSSPTVKSGTSTDAPHPEFADAVAALDALEADIGSFSLSSPPLASRPSSPPAFPAGNDEREADHLGLHTLADCALLFLDALAEPVVTFEAYERALRCEARDEAYRVVRELPEAHANTLLYILAFLRVLLNQTEDPQERAARMDRLAFKRVANPSHLP